MKKVDLLDKYLMTDTGHGITCFLFIYMNYQVGGSSFEGYIAILVFFFWGGYYVRRATYIETIQNETN